MNKKNSAIVLGAGPSGLITAWKLLEAGWEVKIIEKKKITGGLCRSWKRKDFIYFLKCAGLKNIWDLELSSGKIKHNIKGLMYYGDEPARGGHFDCNFWPYVATAIVKGNWNFREYNIELSEISKVNKSKRGKFL